MTRSEGEGTNPGTLGGKKYLTRSDSMASPVKIELVEETLPAGLGARRTRGIGSVFSSSSSSSS